MDAIVHSADLEVGKKGRKKRMNEKYCNIPVGRKRGGEVII